MTTPAPILPTAVYTANQAAALVQMHPDTLRRKLRVGAVRGKRKGNWRILGSELLKVA